MARIAGLQMKDRWAERTGTPSTSRGRSHVSVYEGAAADGERKRRKGNG